MKTNCFKSVIIILLTLISVISFGQVKQISPPNIISPFQMKKVNSQKAIIKPKKNNTDGEHKNEFDFQSDQNLITIKFNENAKTKPSDFFQEFTRKLEIKNDDTFALIKSEIDDIGFTHYRYQQNYKNLPLDGVQFLLHEKNGKLVSANGNFYSGISLDTNPSITQQVAIQKAIEFVGAEKYLWNNKDEEYFLKKEKNDNNASYYPKAVLMIAPIDGIFRKDNFKLCYRVNIFSELPYDNVDVYIDAQTGKIINKIGKIAKADVVGTANTLYSGTKTITMDNNAGTYRLRETTRPIQTFNMKNGTNYSAAIDFTNLTNNWTSQEIILNTVTISSVNNNWEDGLEQSSLGGKPDIFIEIRDASNNVIWSKANAYFNNTFPPITINNMGEILSNGPYILNIYDFDVVSNDLLGSFSFNAVAGTATFSSNGTSGSISISARNNPGLDVHWAMEKTYDFYLSQLSRNSFDGAGSLIKNYVHPDLIGMGKPDNDNAFWNGYAMTYGDGTSLFSPVTSIDVVGHEFSHAVVQYTANLYYQNESGALNESFADIFGTAIEFYGATLPNWNMGESCTIQSPFFLRSMSNPNGGYNSQPDTYNGQYWAPLIPSSYPTQPQTTTNDNGGVHTNSGVQNYWFYLLSQGGSGTNDINNLFSVTGIGINKATKIAYRNLSYYLTPTSNYLAAWNGSLQAAEDLYPTTSGILSQEYNSVKQAWYAVGIGSNPASACSGTTNLTAISSTFSDGSGNSNYSDSTTCKWVIAPAGASQISLNFTTFNTEATYDIVTVYDGPTESYPVLATWWGNTLPPTITSTGGAMCIKFTTDSTTNYSGWTANYTSVISTPACSGITMFTTPSGTFSDGSGTNNYTNNQSCFWYIAPPCASSVTLSFSQFDTELNYDGVVIYDSLSATNQIGAFSGTTIPSSITSTTGTMLVVFVSDFANNYQGFTANYTSTGSSYCGGVTTLNTVDYGTITDGSGGNTYCNNSNCAWLIQPPQATSVTLNFTAFQLEPASTDGNSVYDSVEVYDGTSASATLLGRFTGSTIPPSITSSGGSMYLRFLSDYADAYQGWSAYYTSTQTPFCNGTSSTLTASSGSFSDGSGATKYSNNSNCSWLIQPTSATSITLSFSSFDTELNYDGVIVYDGVNSSSPVLGQFTGSTLPAAVTSTGGSMYVSFLSDEALRANGWNASYTSTNSSGGGTTTYHLDRKVLSSAGKTQTAGSTIITWTLGEPIVGNMNAGSVKLTNGFHPLLTSQALEIQDHSIDFSIIIAPNPASDHLIIYQKENHELNVKLFDITGKNLLEKNINTAENKLDVSFLPVGTYLVYVQDKLTNKTNTYKIIKN